MSMNAQRQFRTNVIATRILRNARGEALTAQDGCCRYCFVPITLAASTADHVTPRSKGGTNVRANIVAACQDCNLSKGSLNVKSFVEAIKHPRPGMPLSLWLTWSRRRMWLATHRACRHMRAAVGLENTTPIGRKIAA